MITKYVRGEVHSWDEFVDNALFSCRIRKHNTTGLSPFFMTYGVEPVLPGDSKRPFMEPMIEEDSELIAEDTLSRIRRLREERFKAREKMKSQAEKDKANWDKKMKGPPTQRFEIVE